MTNEVSTAELAGLTGMFGAPVLLNFQADTPPYPIYVYGYFVNGKNKKGEDNILSGEGVVFSKDIKIQKDGKKVQTVIWNAYSTIWPHNPESHFITFGKIEDGTTVKPAKKAEKESISDNDLEAKLTDSLGDSTDMQNSYFNWKDVAIEDWDLHISHGATNYSDEDGKYTWHMDGKINVYKIEYMNGKSDVSQNAHVDKDTYYCGEYTIDTYKPNAPKGKVFAGWTVKGDTSGKYYQGGDTITLKDHDTNNTGIITLQAQWEDFPVYVYGCFKHKNANGTDENLGSTAALYVNGNQVKWNPDSDKEDKKEYYITFGKLANATSADPSDYSSDEVSKGISTDAIRERINKGEVVLSNDTGSAKANGLLENPTDIPKLVSSWSGLKSRPGAASYKEETKDKQTWHLDGTIYLYKVTYERGNLPEDEVVTPPEEKTYFLGNYTVNDQEPTSNKFNFTGWKLKGEDGSLSTKTYKSGDSIPNSKKDITLVAQWERKPVTVTFKIVNGTWGDANTTTTIPVSLTDGKGTLSSEDVNRILNGIVAADGFKTTGTWDTTPNTQTDGITDDVTYTYTLDAIQYTNATVTFVIKNGKWEDGSTSIQNTVQLKDGKGTLDANQIPDTTKVSHETGYKTPGVWNVTPNTTLDAITGDITYTYTLPKNTLTLTFMIRGGTWDGTAGNNNPIVFSGCVPGEDGYYFMPDGTELPTGMVADDSYIADSGKWYRLDGTSEILVNNISNEKFNVDTTYIFVFAPKPAVQPDTILDVLNGRVWKDFTARYNRSTSGTFTATATVVAKPQQEAIPYAAEENVPTDSNTKIFTGTVALSTGQQTEPFVFKGENAPLSTKTEYTITVTEEDSQQSYVIYDETVYTITFITDADGKINKEGITITPNNSEATTDTTNKTITFKNIYTYKKSSHSSGDSGNGGGKKEEKPTVEIKDDDALGLNNTDHFAYIVGYGNGEVRPQNSITRAEVASIFFRLLEDDVRDANYTRQNKFTDVSNDAWYCSAVSTLSAMGIISGYPDATFRPNASITRAEFAAIATRFDVNGDKTPASFNDIADHWAKDEIAVAANNGWVNGYEDGSFRPQNKITRAETMSLVNRVLNRKPETAEDLLENMAKWTDNADTNAWYYLAVQEATNSHYYEYKENSQYEKWTELRETRDWSELDK